MKDDNADDIECRLEVISGITNNFIVCISKIQHMNTQSQLHGRISEESNYFYCRI